MIVYKAESNVKKQSFKKSVKLLVLSLAIFILTGLGRLWIFLSAYEQSYPSYQAEQFVHKLNNNDYLSAIDLLKIEYDNFNSREYLAKSLQSIIGGGKNLELTESKNEENYQYIIKGRNGSITLTATHNESKSLFGFREYTTRAAESDFHNWEISSAKDTDIYINGVKLTNQYLTDKKATPPGFSVLLDQNSAPTLYTYIVPNIYLTPEIVSDANTISINNNNQTVLIAPFSDDIPALREDIIKTTAVTYANFVSDDASFSQISKYLHHDTEFFNSLKNFSNFWYVEHDSAKAENIEIFNYCEYSKDAFSAEITFDYRIKQAKYNIDKVYHTHYKISFITLNGTAKAVNIEPM